MPSKLFRRPPSPRRRVLRTWLMPTHPEACAKPDAVRHSTDRAVTLRERSSGSQNGQQDGGALREASRALGQDPLIRIINIVALLLAPLL